MEQEQGNRNDDRGQDRELDDPAEKAEREEAEYDGDDYGGEGQNPSPLAGEGRLSRRLSEVRGVTQSVTRAFGSPTLTQLRLSSFLAKAP